MKKKLIIVVVLILFSSGSSLAELFKYVDKEGNIHYTNDLSTVPRSQRKGVEEYIEFHDKKDSEPADVTTDVKDEQIQKDIRADNLDQDPTANLYGQKEELEKEYRQLQQEKKLLDEERKTVRSKADAKKYNTKTKQLKQKIEQYESKSKALMSEIKAYNSELEKKLKKTMGASGP